MLSREFIFKVKYIIKLVTWQTGIVILSIGFLTMSGFVTLVSPEARDIIQDTAAEIAKASFTNLATIELDGYSDTVSIYVYDQLGVNSKQPMEVEIKERLGKYIIEVYPGVYNIKYYKYYEDEYHEESVVIDTKKRRISIDLGYPENDPYEYYEWYDPYSGYSRNYWGLNRQYGYMDGYGYYYDNGYGGYINNPYASHEELVEIPSLEEDYYYDEYTSPDLALTILNIINKTRPGASDVKVGDKLSVDLLIENLTPEEYILPFGVVTNAFFGESSVILPEYSSEEKVDLGTKNAKWIYDTLELDILPEHSGQKLKIGCYVNSLSDVYEEYKINNSKEYEFIINGNQEDKPVPTVTVTTTPEPQKESDNTKPNLYVPNGVEQENNYEIKFQICNSGADIESSYKVKDLYNVVWASNAYESNDDRDVQLKSGDCVSVEHDMTEFLKDVEFVPGDYDLILFLNAKTLFIESEIITTNKLGFTFSIDIDPQSKVRGDVDLDGDLDLMDLVFLGYFINKKEPAYSMILYQNQAFINGAELYEPYLEIDQCDMEAGMYIKEGLDLDGFVCSLHENNTLPDLVSEDIKIYETSSMVEVDPMSLESGKSYTIKAIITNEGAKSTGDFKYKWSLFSSSEMEGISSGLSVGETKEGFEWRFTAKKDITSIRFVADSKLQIEEMYDSNNAVFLNLGYE